MYLLIFIKTKCRECEICPVAYSRIQIDVLQEKMKDQMKDRLPTVCMEPNVGLEPINREIMTRAETKSRTLN